MPYVRIRWLRRGPAHGASRAQASRPPASPAIRSVVDPPPSRPTSPPSLPGAPPQTTDSALHLIATCTFGLESVVARELSDIGYSAKPTTTGRVEWTVSGSAEDQARAIIRANLWLRAADRILIAVGRFPVGSGDPGFDDLFNGVRAIPWERWIRKDAACPVAGRCVRSQLSSEPAVQRATKRAIVERMRSAYSLAPNAMLPETGATVAVEVSILKDVATLTIDSSGPGLHKRGYREGTPGEAALKETMAAGLVLLSGWRPELARQNTAGPLVDPFCGSGTIAIEAALLARDIAPGLRREFAAEYWGATTPRDGGWAGGARLIDPALWREERDRARAAIKPSTTSPIIHASDISDEALRLARLNASRAGVERDIVFARRDARELTVDAEHGCVVTNPPYGVRLGAEGPGAGRSATTVDERELDRLYRALPIVFRRLPSWSFHIFTGRLDLEALFGQAATRRRKMYNSTIECCFFSFLGPKPPGLSKSDWDKPSDAAQTLIDAPEPVSLPDADEFTILQPVSSEQPAARQVAGPGSSSQLARPASPARPVAAFGGLRERDEKEAQELAACLGNNLRHLRKYPGRGITCFRVYERDVPDVPLIIDRYEDRYHASEYEREHSRTSAQQADWFDLMRKTIAQTAGVPIEHVYMKEKHRQRGLTQHEKIGEARNTIIAQENGLRFEVNLSDYIDTGLFLDHRLTRQMVREQSAGKRFLNLFCYTASFTVYAASGGATASTSVDLSNTYLDWAERNLRLNSISDIGTAHRLVRSDVIEFLRAHPQQTGGCYDLAIVDPPTFSNSKSTREDWEVASRHGEMLSLLSPLMAPGGLVYFSTNFRKFKLDTETVAAAGYEARDISARTVPPEYRNKKVHHCWRLTKK